MLSEPNLSRQQETLSFKDRNPKACGEMFHSYSVAENFTETREKPTKTVSAAHGPINCRQCLTSFHDHFSLNAHMFDVHGRNSPFHCQVCGKAYQTSTGLNLHMATHSGKSHVCPICDKKFTQKGTIVRHLRQVHHMSHCQTCMAVFRVGDEFNQHVLHCHG